MSKGMQNLIKMNHISQRLTRHLIHQRDIDGYECWILNGVGYREGLSLKKENWQWIKGPDGGAWMTSDINQGNLALNSAIKNDIPIIKIGNGWITDKNMRVILNIE